MNLVLLRGRGPEGRERPMKGLEDVTGPLFLIGYAVLEGRGGRRQGNREVGGFMLQFVSSLSSVCPCRLTESKGKGYPD